MTKTDNLIYFKQLQMDIKNKMDQVDFINYQIPKGLRMRANSIWSQLSKSWGDKTDFIFLLL